MHGGSHLVGDRTDRAGKHDRGAPRIAAGPGSSQRADVRKRARAAAQTGCDFEAHDEPGTGGPARACARPPAYHGGVSAAEARPDGPDPSLARRFAALWTALERELDWGALGYIVANAGGVVSGLDGKPLDIFENFSARSSPILVSSSPSVHERLLAALRKQ